MQSTGCGQTVFAEKSPKTRDTIAVHVYALYLQQEQWRLMMILIVVSVPLTYYVEALVGSDYYCWSQLMGSRVWLLTTVEARKSARD